MRDIASEVEAYLKTVGLAVPCIVEVRLKVDRDGRGLALRPLSISKPSASPDDLAQLIVPRLPEGTRQLININGIEDLCGVSRETVRELIAASDFPPNVQLKGVKARLWWRHEVENWRDASVLSAAAPNPSLGGRRRPRRNPPTPGKRGPLAASSA